MDETALGLRGKGPSEHERDNRHKFHDNVERGSRGVLEWVTDGVTNDGGLAAALEHFLNLCPHLGGGLLAVLGDADKLHAASLVVANGENHFLTLDVLLGVVPGSTGVGGRDGHRRSGRERAEQKPSEHLDAKEESDDERCEEHEASRRNHLLERRIGCDLNALGVVFLGRLELAIVSALGLLGLAGEATGLDLTTDFLDHLEGGGTDRLHCHGEEPVRDHSADDKASELPLSNEGNLVDTDGVRKGSKERERDERGGADGKALANGGRGVTGGVEGIGAVADDSGHAGHLGDATSVVSDWAVSVDGETRRERHEHTERGAGDAKHLGEGVANKHGSAEADDGDDRGLVTEGESVDDVGGCAGLGGLGDLLGGRVAVRSVVLCHEADDEAGPETDCDADASLVPFHGLAADVKFVGEKEARHGKDERRREHGGDTELDLERTFDGFVLNRIVVGNRHKVRREKVRHEAGDEPGGAEHDGERHRREVDGEVLGLRAENKRGARGLGERTEKVCAHTSNITDVITDIVSDHSGVAGIVLVPVVVDLTSEVSADVSSLGVDPAADAAEHSNGRATETVPSDALVHGDGARDAVTVVVVGLAEEAAVDFDKNDENENAERHESKTHDRSRAERGLEARAHTLIRLDGRTRVRENSNAHANVSSDDGGGAADQERNARRDARGPVADSAENEQDNGAEADHEGEHVQVLAEEERLGARADVARDLLEAFVDDGIARRVFFLTDLAGVDRTAERLGEHALLLIRTTTALEVDLDLRRPVGQERRKCQAQEWNTNPEQKNGRIGRVGESHQ